MDVVVSQLGDEEDFLDLVVHPVPAVVAVAVAVADVAS
jgi:hypothetical protein